MQVELLSSVLWRGVVNPGGTVLDLPAETAERLIEAGLAKSAKKAAAKPAKDEAKAEPKKKAPRKKAAKKSNSDE
tara:strand:+ start:2060 stop:2284 length:225 start_codon:yes stop_codon:yes gene_type:complete